MERLQEAIEKARDQREGKIGQIANQSPARPEAKDEAIPAEKDKKGRIEREEGKESKEGEVVGSLVSEQQPEPAKVTYSKTRRIDVDEATLKKNRIIAGFHHDQRVEYYRQLRSQVLSEMNQNNWNTLAITSPGENAGKTLTSINLAVSIAQEVNQTVMLVDLDLRKPNVHESFGVDVEKGIVDCLFHNEPMEDILFNPGFPRLVIMPGRALGRHSSELLTSPEMNGFLQEVKTRYQSRIIIFDLPPLLRNDDALVFTPNVDASLLVIEDGVTTPDDITRSIQLLGRSHLIGTILNKAR